MIRRAQLTDAKAIAEFLRALFVADPSAGDPTSQTTAKWEVVLANPVMDCWVSVEGGAITGILKGQRGALIQVLGVERTANYFDLLAVSHTLDRKNLRRVSKELTLFSVDDLTASGTAAQMIWVVGPKTCKGAQWCRLIGMSEDTTYPEAFFLLPFSEIWAKVGAVSLG